MTCFRWVKNMESTFMGCVDVWFCFECCIVSLLDYLELLVVL